MCPQRQESVLRWVEDLLEVPMVFLSLLILLLLGMELLLPLSPEQRRGILLGEWIIWSVFLLHFFVTFSLDPDKSGYLRRNWIIVLSLFIPFLRVLMVARAIQAIRVLATARLITLTNRAIRQLGLVLQARRILFVTSSSLIVILVSSVGMYFLERQIPGSPITSYGVALWFTTRSVMNADVPVAPLSAEGRFLGVLISLYGFAVFGVITAALASWFITADRREEQRRQHIEGTAVREAAEKIREDLASHPHTPADIRRQLDQIIALIDEQQHARRKADESS